MPSDEELEILRTVGNNLVIKVARIVAEAPFYGVYLILVYYFITIFGRRRLRVKRSIFLAVIAAIMFIGCSGFFAMDVADLVVRLRVIFVERSNLPLEEKLARADHLTEPLMWAGQMLFIFLLPLGDCVVVWRTWALYQDQLAWLVIPVLTLTGSFATAIFELGCDIKTDWALDSVEPSAASIGPETCRRSDVASYSLSFATNVLCTGLIFYKAWSHRRYMNQNLGSARARSPVDKILTLFCESGAAYVVLYVGVRFFVLTGTASLKVKCAQTLQSIPIYSHSLSNSALIAMNIVNAIIQQAMGMYPTAIVVICHMQRSLWDSFEVPSTASSTQPISRVSRMRFAAPAHSTQGETSTTVTDSGEPASTYLSRTPYPSSAEKKNRSNDEDIV
ncbi:hypothetical protein VNI00_013724 [Paramarasmius palmivorus]|uniref:Uncharacterized protein n=1 Tax=Paramarasmius palmivorus TaxID=297713 RepID=A0AAW0BW22_9AGAR